MPGAATSVWRANGGFKRVNIGEEAFAQAGLAPGCRAPPARGSLSTARPWEGAGKGDVRGHPTLGLQGALQLIWRSPSNEAGHLLPSCLCACVIRSVLINNSARDKLFPA